MSAREAAAQAAREALRVYHDEGHDQCLGHMVAAAVDAYEQQRPIESVHLLRPAPGDAIMFRVRAMTELQLDEFITSLQPLRERYPEVLFVACEVEGVSVMRPLQEVAGKTGLDKLREVANRPMSRDEFAEKTTSRICPAVWHKVEGEPRCEIEKHCCVLPVHSTGNHACPCGQNVTQDHPGLHTEIELTKGNS